MRRERRRYLLRLFEMATQLVPLPWKENGGILCSGRLPWLRNCRFFVLGQEVESRIIRIQHGESLEDDQVLASMSCTDVCKQATTKVANGSFLVGSSPSGLED
jgi:hypothetical protein